MSATRILTVADVHQHRALLADLASAVEQVRPAAVVSVGDRSISTVLVQGWPGWRNVRNRWPNLRRWS